MKLIDPPYHAALSPHSGKVPRADKRRLSPILLLVLRSKETDRRSSLPWELETLYTMTDFALNGRLLVYGQLRGGNGMNVSLVCEWSSS